ncbi:MAG TPA: tetratricopeptide repeat protein [Acidobacteriota bacterium]|nr:tetratricopeptide repeat protein [Acidobacteriota bacterium]
MASEGDRPDFDRLWDYDHPDSTEAAFRALLPAAETSGDRDYLAQLLIQIARAQGLQMDFDAAAATLDRAEALLTPELRVARVRLLLERGRVLNSSKRREESKPLFRAAWDRAREAGADAYAVDAAHMLGIVETGDSSLAWNRTALDAAERSAEPKARKWLGSLHNNVGWTHHDRGEFETALDHFRKALREREAAGLPDPVRIARWCVARTHRSLKRYDEALAEQRALLAENEAAGSPDGFVEEEIGECLTALGRDGDAKPHFAAAHALLSKDPWLARDEPERLERLRRLGGVPAPGEGGESGESGEGGEGGGK